MYRSLPRTLPLIALLSFVAAGCSMFGHEGSLRRRSCLHTATMDLTPGIAVNALVETPPGFTPIAGQPPLWLQGGKELALAGTLMDARRCSVSTVGGYKKAHRSRPTADPAHRTENCRPGREPQMGMTLAVAEAMPGRIEIVLRYIISNARWKLGRDLRRQLSRGEPDLDRARYARGGSGGRVPPPRQRRQADFTWSTCSARSRSSR